MKTFKKLFSVSAIVALLGTLMPIYAFGANYTTELVQAYDYAYGHKITTMTSIDNADMYGNLTRIAMAKMLANYAIDVLGLTPDTTKECTFPDVSAALDAQYDNGVTKACQLGLMGVGITNFNPNGLVTRAEFGTAFSRALNANDADKLAEMNKADPYYKDHLNFLKEEGIMTKIDTPSQLEVRGYVMLMMMRSDSTYTPTEGCSAEELLKCLTADDYDACIAECSDGDNNEEVVTGNGLATVSKVGSTNTVEIPVLAVNVKVGTIKLTAGEYDTKVSAVEITKGGLGYFGADSLQVALRNENIETEFASVSTSTDKVKVKFSPALTIKAGKSETFDVVVNVLPTDAELMQNNTYTFSVTDLVVANGKAAGTPVQLGTIKTTTALPKTVDVTIDDGTATIKAGDTEKLIAKINIVFDKSAGKLNRIGLVNVETVDTAKLGDAFDNVNAYVDGKKVGKVSVQDEKIVISDLNMNKAKDDEVNIELKADAIYDDEEAYFLFRIDSIDITQEGYDFGLVPASYPNDIEQAHEVRVVGNNITFKKVALTTKEVLPGTKNVVLYDATFKSAIDVRITDILIEGSSELDDTVVSEGTAKIVINGEEIELDADDIIDSTSVSRPLTNKKIDVDANTEVHVKIILSTKKPASTADIVNMESQYKVTLSGRGLENVNNTFGPTSPVQGDKVIVKEGTAEIVASTVTAPATRSLFPNKDQEAGRFGIKADGDALTLNEITLSYTTSLEADEFETLFDGNFSLVDVDTDDIISADFDLDKAAKTLKISNIKDYEIAKDETANLKLMVNLGSLDGFYGDTVKFSVKADSIDAKTSVRTLKTNDTYALTSDNYKLRMLAPEIELTKMSEKKFKVVIKNTDRDTAIDVKNLRYRVVTTVADSDFKGSVCLTTDANLIECASDTHAFGARGTELSTTESISAKGSVTYYIVVDGTSIEPEVLQADISALSYEVKDEAITDDSVENYSVSAK